MIKLSLVLLLVTVIVLDTRRALQIHSLEAKFLTTEAQLDEAIAKLQKVQDGMAQFITNQNQMLAEMAQRLDERPGIDLSDEVTTLLSMAAAGSAVLPAAIETTTPTDAPPPATAPADSVPATTTTTETTTTETSTTAPVTDES